MSARLEEFKRKLRTQHFIDYYPSYRASIFVSGTGRSGTTWLADIINYRNEYRYIFEPFHPQRVNVCRNFRYRQYLRPGNRDSAFIEPAKAILSGRARAEWMDSHNNRILSRKRLIKDIRTNQLLKWIHTNFPGLPIVLLLRHPCAVAHSKLQLGWDTHLDEFLAQETLMEDFLNPFKKEIERARDAFDRHLFMWCIENYVPLRQFKKDEVHLAFYETLCANPHLEVERLFRFLKKPFTDLVLARLHNPSSQSRKQSAIVTGADLIEAWRKGVSAEQVQRAVEILKMFRLDCIYSEDSLPNTDNAHNMLRNNA